MSPNSRIITPVLFLIFNRPDLTERVFSVIRAVKPSMLFVAADGPRENNLDDIEKCRTAREIVNQVDWDCRVERLYRDKNLGCRIGVSSAIDWFFKNVDEGIILEDDCVPSRSFFWFCQELLEKYRYDERIMHIGGTNYTLNRKNFNGSYYFSKRCYVWGWATWRRAWRHFDLEMKDFSRFKEENQIDNYFDSREVSSWTMGYLEEAHSLKHSCWSTQWYYAIIIRNALMICPAVNLVQNLGKFREDATHAKGRNWDLYTGFRAEEINEIIHPPFVLPDKEADNINFEIVKKTDPRLIHKRRLEIINSLKRIVPQKAKDTMKALFKIKDKRSCLRCERDPKGDSSC